MIRPNANEVKVESLILTAWSLVGGALDSLSQNQPPYNPSLAVLSPPPQHFPVPSYAYDSLGASNACSVPVLLVHLPGCLLPTGTSEPRLVPSMWPQQNHFPGTRESWGSCLCCSLMCPQGLAQSRGSTTICGKSECISLPLEVLALSLRFLLCKSLTIPPSQGQVKGH